MSPPLTDTHLVYCLCLACYIRQKLDSVSMIPVSLFPSTGEEGPEAVLVGPGAFLITFCSTMGNSIKLLCFSG